MSGISIIAAFNRLCLQNFGKTAIKRHVSTATPLAFRATPCLMAEPLKKKKKMDPQVLKHREDRKKKKIEKQIRRLEKNASQLKPIDECEVPITLLDEKRMRTRQLPAMTAEVLEYRAGLEKRWAAYKAGQHLANVQMLDRVAYAQQRALDQLRKESEELYMEAVQPDFLLLPFKAEGPLETPPLENYDSPDGDYVDVSKKWE